MSEQKKSLAEAIVREVFGPEVGSAAGYLCRWRRGSLQDVVNALTEGWNDNRRMAKSSKIADSLAVLIQHNLVTFAVGAGGGPEYVLSLDAVLRIIRYPKYLLQVREALGVTAVLLFEELLRRGQLSASRMILNSLIRKKDKSKSVNKGKSVINGNSSSAEANEVFKAFKDLVAKRLIIRVPVLDIGKPIPMPRNQNNDQQPDEEDLFELPDLKLGPLATEAAKDEPDIKVTKSSADRDVLWRINDASLLERSRDELLASAATRRADSAEAGELMSTVLGMAGAPWDAALSGHVYATDIAARVNSSPKSSDILKTYRDQYLKLMGEDATGFLRRVGDEGGGAFEVNFAGSFEKLAEATIENVVMEKFSSKALRIFRVVRSKVYVEETQIQSLVMLPTKETKLLTYQLLENGFIHLQELRKSLGNSAHSKAFYLFYCDLNRVARLVLEMCYKSTFNMLARQVHEVQANKRLLDKQEKVESISENIRKTCEAEGNMEGLDEQLQEVQEMLSPPETAQVRFVHRSLDKLSKAANQVDETIFVLDMYLALASPT